MDIDFTQLKDAVIIEHFALGCPAIYIPEDFTKEPLLLFEADLCAGRLDLASAAINRGNGWELPTPAMGGPNDIYPLAWLSESVVRLFSEYWNYFIPKKAIISDHMGQLIMESFIERIKEAKL